MSQTDQQRRAWLQRRREARTHIPLGSMLGAMIATETGWSCGTVERVLAGGTVRHDIDREILAAKEKLAPLIDDFYADCERLAGEVGRG